MPTDSRGSASDKPICCRYTVKVVILTWQRAIMNWNPVIWCYIKKWKEFDWQSCSFAYIHSLPHSPASWRSHIWCTTAICFFLFCISVTLFPNVSLSRIFSASLFWFCLFFFHLYSYSFFLLSPYHCLYQSSLCLSRSLSHVLSPVK